MALRPWRETDAEALYEYAKDERLGHRESLKYSADYMKKILVIGCPGSGKSTFARKLAAKTGVPLYYLDMVWHRPDRTTVSREEFINQLDELTLRNEWIIDGNYLHSLPLRLKHCDTVFLFDLPLEICLSGAEERIGKARVDMPWVETEMDQDFRQWIIDFPATQLPVIERLLKEYEYRIRIIRFQTRKDADSFIESVCR